MSSHPERDGEVERDVHRGAVQCPGPEPPLAHRGESGFREYVRRASENLKIAQLTVVIDDRPDDDHALQMHHLRKVWIVGLDPEAHDRRLHVSAGLMDPELWRRLRIEAEAAIHAEGIAIRIAGRPRAGIVSSGHLAESVVGGRREG